MAVALVIGGGPSGLHIADLLSKAGFSVVLAERMPSVGRKFLIAGKGGLNLTHSEALSTFVTRYESSTDEAFPGSPAHWQALLNEFSPMDLRKWSEALEIPTFIGTSGRVFPETKQAAPLLRRWVSRIKSQGASFLTRHEWLDFEPLTKGGWRSHFSTPTGPATIESDRLFLCMGGGSWPQSGSNAAWIERLSAKLKIAALFPANCGYEVAWPTEFAKEFEGVPLKNIAVTAGIKRVLGELLITRYGLEGGAIYQLGGVLRRQARENRSLEITIDFKPSFSVDQLLAKLQPVTPEHLLAHAVKAWRLSPAACKLITSKIGLLPPSPEILGRLVKSFPVTLTGPRPIAEAISTSGGIAWSELDSNLQLRRFPGVYCAGEMIDWDAPTGGYLLQGSFATAHRAANAAIRANAV